MKTELLALIENYGKALVHQTEGKISAFKDAKNLMSNIVFLLDKAEQEEAAIGAGGVERLRSDAPAAVKPPASQRDELLQVALDFIGTLTGMSPPPIEVAPPEVFAPFYDFVDRVQAITSAAPAAPADALDAERWRYAMDWDNKEFAVCKREGMSWTPIKTDGAIDRAMSPQKNGGA